MNNKKRLNSRILYNYTMQLPWGTFREIRKKGVLGSILSELEQTRFTGACGIVTGPATGTFVYRDGICILARFRGIAGSKGFSEMQKSAGDVVDVIISTLDDAQIRLSREFNAACILKEPGMVTPDQPAAGKKPVDGVHYGDVKPTVRVSRKRPVIPAGTPQDISRNRLPKKDAIRRVLVHSHEDKRAVPADNISFVLDDIESDMNALDSMDLDKVTSRIRRDCKILVQSLDLEYLMHH